MEELLVPYRPITAWRSADKGLLVQTKYNQLMMHKLWAGRFQIKNQNISFYLLLLLLLL